MEEIIQQLWVASDAKNMCRIQLKGEPLPRTVEPYGVSRTSRNQIMLVCWQTMGFTKAGRKAGYRNLALSEIEEVEILEEHFRVRDDFNPADGQYAEWVYHV